MSTPAAQTVSVVIAVYNGERFLAECLESVLSQTVAPAEVIVVDDGSTDCSDSIVKRYPTVRYHRIENVGQPAALNRGIGWSTGALLAFNDADDVWLPDKLERQLHCMHTTPTVDAVFGWCEQFHEQDAPAEAVEALTGERRRMLAQLPAAMLIRRAAFARVGDFDESLRIGSAVDWYHRAESCGLVMETLPDTLYRRRIHSDNLGWRERASANRAYLAVARRAIERRRASA